MAKARAVTTTTAEGRGALTIVIVTMMDDRAEWAKCEEMEGGVGAGQNVCTRSFKEGYRGSSGAKNAFSPHKSPENLPKVPPPSRASSGSVSVSQLPVIP
jgi:hypothetical protein